MSSRAALNAKMHRFSCVGSLLIDQKQLALIPNYCHRNRVPEFLGKLELCLSFLLSSLINMSDYLLRLTILPSEIYFK